LAIGDWRLLIVDWRFETGDSRLAIRDWFSRSRLESAIDNQSPLANPQSPIANRQSPID
jgi:hypothetical protein